MLSDFDVTIEGLRAASLLMSQKSVPAKQFNLDEIIESNMYKRHPVLRVLDGEAALNFMLHMIKMDIP